MKKWVLISIIFTTFKLFAGVNPQTGNFFFTVQDYQKQCHQMTLSIQRSYNSLYRQSGLFGKSWLSNLERKIIPVSNISLELIEADGYVSQFYLESLISDKEKSVDAIIKRKKNLDIEHTGNPKGNGDQHYSELKEKMLNEHDYFLTQLQRYQPNTITTNNSVFVSQDRKSSTLSQHKNGFKRTFINGDTEEYNTNGELILEKNRHNTFIRYIYNNGLLKTIRDSCGQYVNINYDKKNRIKSIQSSHNKTVHYSYDDQNIKNTLSRFTGMDGQSLNFKYDKFFRLTGIEFPSETIKIVYDQNSGKVAEHHGPGKNKNSYTYTSYRGKNITRITDEQKQSHSYTFIPAKNQSIYTAPDGTEQIKTTLACCGKLSSIKDKKGQGETYIYDKNKQNLIELQSTKDENVFYTYNDIDLISSIQKGKTTLNINYNSEHLPKLIKKNNQTLVEADYDMHGDLLRVHDRTSDILIQRKNNGDIQQIQLKQNNQTYVVKIQYQHNDEIQDKLFEPNSAQTASIIEQEFNRLLNLLQLKPYLPNTS
ncbi:MAG TPA: DUF6531 domain-containing protein [Oligoflexia bacterium]|nr:DUF6531 domain-containing protein [Oligoflexia bacterium]HMR24404.1 DUF6531 domain-containing protein [Oligoflexia bacterium]